MAFHDLWIILYWFILIGVFLRVVFKRRPVGDSFAWMLVIVLLPLVGLILYFMFGERQLGRKRAVRARAMRDPFIQNFEKHVIQQTFDIPSTAAGSAVYQIMQEYVGTGSLNYHHLQTFTHPDTIFKSWIQSIQAAEHTIRAEFYIWDSAGRVQDIELALIAAAKRGVRVQLLIDHAGSWRFFLLSSQLKRMREAGIECIAMLPVSIFRNVFRRIDLRMHRKLLLIDNKVAYTGSMNMADPLYFNANKQVGAWVDLVIRFEGEAAFAASKIFSWDWEMETGQRDFVIPGAPFKQNQQKMILVPSGPDMGTDIIQQVMITSLYRAERKVMISTPYFVPSEPLFMALCHAAERGVEVYILLPEKNDSRLAGLASQSYFGPFLRAGGRILLFKDGLLHTKALVVDEQIAFVGSVNFDVRSFQLNFEISFALYDLESCRTILSILLEYQEQSYFLSLAQWDKRSRWQRLKERLSFFLSPLL